MVAAFGAGQGVDFVDDDGVEGGEEGLGGGLGEEDGEGFGGGEKDVWGGFELAAAQRGGGVAGAGFDADGEG